MALRSGKQVNIAKDTMHTDEILVLQIASAAPFAYIDPDGIVAGMYMIGDVEFSC